MAVTPTPAAAPPAAAPPPAHAATARRARVHGILDLVAIIASALYAGATFVICMWGAHLFTPDRFNEIQDAWGLVTTAFVAIQVLTVVVQAGSYKRSVIGKLEKFSSLATVFVVAVLGLLFLIDIAPPYHWAIMVWSNAGIAGVIDLLLLWHAYWLARQP